MTKGLPLASMTRLMKEAGAERISQSAKEALKEVLEEEVKVIMEKALTNALNSGRKTVTEEDVKKAKE